MSSTPDWIASANWYLQRIVELQTMLESREALTKAEVRLARQRMESIKQRFEDDGRQCSALAAEGRLDPQGDRFANTIREARQQVAPARSDTHPLRGRWSSQLYACKVEFQQFVHRERRDRSSNAPSTSS